MSDKDKKDFRALGSETSYNFDAPDPSLLESFPSPAVDRELNPAGAPLSLHIEAPEFTSLCPITGQPDFATIVIDYEPDKLCVESKSLKLYLMGYRNHGTFHEACVTRICNDLVKLLDPVWLRVEGRFTPRGGIPFQPVMEYFRDDVTGAGESGND
jgi:7-cyano-7-deazaguanine reductase